MNEPIKAEELQHILRQFDALHNLTVSYESDVVATTTLIVSGLVQINGEMKAYETHVDSTQFTNADDVLQLVGALLESFERASKESA